MFKKAGIIATAVFIAAAGAALAAEDPGVKIYPGAKKDEQWSKVQAQIVQATGGGTGVCYRTADPVAKVAAFYQNEGFKVSVGQVTADSAILQKGQKLNMTLKFMKPLDDTNDTRICIAKKK